MYVIIVGGGRVGYYLARDLTERGEEVTLIERGRDLHSALAVSGEQRKAS